MEFKRSADIGEQLELVCGNILQTTPLAILIVWETPQGFRASTVPPSMALARGLLLEANKFILEDDDNGSIDNAFSDDDME